ncbi:MAG: hypothetical protein IPH84_00760 [Bacteroidales bacterium]|nr:hypothetical protein [Bacteroidales bacterium]
MNGSYRFIIDDDKRIVTYYHQGMLKIEDIGIAWQDLVLLDEFRSKGYNLLSDYSDADFDFSVHKTEIIWDYLKSIKDILRNKKEAVIATTPTATAISMLFEKETYLALNFKVKIFSTRDAAISWLVEA